MDRVLRAGIITVSDRAARGEREDASGPALRALLEREGIAVEAVRVLPDDRGQIAAEILCMADELELDLVLTTGGTGVGPRDVTPEATADVLERALPGIAETMRARSLEVTPRAMLSRAAAGVRARSLVVNLPGSPRGACECLGFVLPVMRHAVELIRGEVADCATPENGAMPEGRPGG